jgi:diketogulonate reductase-like aldo/keto reductase
MSQSIDPDKIPQRSLYTGHQMPAIGLGTFGSDHVSPERVAATVEDAIRMGYRHIDCASVYHNQNEVGEALARSQESGIARSEFWITSKLWNDKHAEAEVVPDCRRSLRELQLDYFDMYLVHWPFPNFHPPGCDVSSRSPNARPYIHEDFMKTWRQMEKLVGLGLATHIGTSNMTRPKLELLLRDAEIKPAVNEMELHPHFQQPELFEFVRAQGIEPVGFCPIGSPQRPERDRTPEDTSPLDDPVINRIAKLHGVHPAVICVKWAEQRGQTPIPFSTNPQNYYANLKSVTEDPLSPEEMEAIAGLDRNCRLIKGQVFLWKEDQTWEDLWDLDGRIASSLFLE